MMKARKPKRYAGGGVAETFLAKSGMRDLGKIADDLGGKQPWNPIYRFMQGENKEDAERKDLAARLGVAEDSLSKMQADKMSSPSTMKRGGPVKEVKSGSKPKKPLYERPRPANMKSKTMTPTQKAAASRIAKASGDKKVGLFARINAMKKVK
jgi:hypothetical protein